MTPPTAKPSKRLEIRDIELYLNGFRAPLALQISEQDASRLDHVLQTWNPDHGREFFVWDVPNGGAAAVSVKDIQVVTSEWDGETSDEEIIRVPGEEPEDDRLLLWLRGRDPMWIAVTPDEMVADILFYLEGIAEEFVFCLGDTDTFVYIGPEQLVHLYVPRELYRESVACQDAIRKAEEEAATPKSARGGKHGKARAKPAS